MSNRESEILIESLLEKRGIPKEEQEAFRHPDFERDTHSPWLLPDIKKAVERLVEAKEHQEQVIIFGDYDADGVPATALLVRVLKRFGYTNIQGLIPTRAQGYGLTESVVADIIARKPAVVIAVDNGTVAKQEVAHLTAAGISVIIADHHEPQEGKVADSALAIINPKMADSEYPFRELCACALAWKLTCALAETLGEDIPALKWELDLVGLSTIADMVPLIGENRVLAQFGLKVLTKTRNLGLQALKEVAGITGELSSGDVGFKLAPRINAPSRLHNETLDGEHSSLTLLTTGDKQVAQTIAEHLHLQNADRQKLVDVHIAQAEEQLGESESLVIVAYHDSWSSGVIGLVASRLLEKFRRPVIVLAPEGSEIKGSVRSVDGINAIDLLDAGASELERYGGHAKAAGLTLKGNVDTFRAQLQSFMEGQGATKESIAKSSEKHADAELSLEAITLELAEALEELAPFGIGFPTPLFSVTSEVSNLRAVGATGKHMSFFLSKENVSKKAIAFSYRGPLLEEGNEYVFKINVEAEEWRAVKAPVCHVRNVEMLDNAPQLP